MAIIIPSKRIYQKKHQLPKTYIDKVECEEKHLKGSVEILTVVDNQTLDVSNDTSWENNPMNELLGSGYASGEDVFVYMTMLKTNYLTLTFYIDRFKDKNFYNILEMYDGFKENQDTYIKYSVTYKNQKVGKNNIKLLSSGFSYNNYEVDYNGAEEYISIGNIPLTYTDSHATRVAKDKSTLGTAKFDTSNPLQYKITLDLLVGRETRSIAISEHPYPENPNSKYFELEDGVANRIVPISIDISFSGKVSQYEEQTYTLTFGEGTNVFSTNSNELFQSKTTFNGMPINEHNANQIISNYKDGKEVVELLCSINDYYDENNVLAISPTNTEKPMVFAIGDKVIPYNFTAQGDTPLSLYEDGSPKQFKVTQTDFIFDGAVWQKLKLQEISI